MDELISKVQKDDNGMFEEDNGDNLLGSLEDFMITDDSTGPALIPELAKVMNTNFQLRPSEDKCKPLCEKHHRPEDLPRYDGSKDK